MSPLTIAQIVAATTFVTVDKRSVLKFGDGLTLQSIGNIVAGLVMPVLASAKRPRLHTAGTVVAWIVMLGALVLQRMGTPG